MADASEMTKSAKRRAAKKARDAAAAEEAAAPAPPPAPEPKAKAKAKAAASDGGYPAAPTAKAKAKSKAEPAPAPAPEPKAAAKASAKGKAKAEPKAQPKAEPKAQPKAQPKAEPAPAAKAKAEPKAQPKASAAKAKAKPVEKEEPPKQERVELVQPFEMDDGTSGGWEVSTGLNKKQQRRQERLEEEKKHAEMLKKQGVGNAGNKHIPGFNPVLPTDQRIPGMPSQSVTALAQPSVSEVKAALRAAKEGASAEPAKPVVEQVSAQIKVPEKSVGIVIGPKGAKIKLIQEKTGARIDTGGGEMFTITGPAAGVAQAEVAIRDLITKGYTALAYDDFEENNVVVYRESLPDLIGKKGAVIIEIKDKLGVEVNIPKDQGAAKKVKVGIAGPKDKVAQAKTVIDNILRYGHDEITHPGDSHEELDVPDWAYAAIIGSKGSELRHIQNNFGVRVNIPRETSLNDKVVVVGPARDVERAKSHIEKAVYNFSNRGGRKEDKADDGWGDEEPEEEWMKAYMYKR